MVSARCRMGLSPKPRSSSVGITSSRCPTSTGRSTGQPAARRRRLAESRCVPTCPREQIEGDIDPHGAAELAARTSYGRLVAYLAASWRDVAAAEDALGDALLAALEAWPRAGVPGNPEPWVLTAARRHISDAARHAKVQGSSTPAVH